MNVQIVFKSGAKATVQMLEAPVVSQTPFGYQMTWENLDPSAPSGLLRFVKVEEIAAIILEPLE